MLHEESVWHRTEPDRIIIRFCDERGVDWVRVEYENRGSLTETRYESRITWSSGSASPDDGNLYQMQRALEAALKYALMLDIDDVAPSELHAIISGR